jgi:alkylation response protein AidB-like acyl-CoA dehydrogenase
MPDGAGDVARLAADLRTRAEGLVPTIRARTPEAEKLRRLPEETVADIKAAGLHRMAQPQRFGGAQLPLDAIVDAISTLARGCASTAWVTGVYCDHSIIAGMCDPRVAEDVWGGNPDAAISAGYHPSGTAERIAGGWRLAGKWGFASGCDYADWLILGSLLPNDAGGVTPSLCFVPRSDVRIEDNWDVMGLAATGSKNLILEGAVVPEYRTIPFAHVNGTAEMRGRPETPALYRLPHISAVPFLFCATALGIAESFLDETRESISGRSSNGAAIAEFQTMQLHIAEASAEVDCARLLIMRDVRETMAAMEEGRALTLQEKVRNRRDMAYSGRLCSQAVGRLFGATGAVAIYREHIAQQKYRDMAAVMRHVTVNWDIGGTTYGRVALGRDPGPRPI